MDKCTAWPWEVKLEQRFKRPCYSVIANDSFPAAPSYRVLAVLMGGESEEEEKSNAYLMASAKDLYEALECLQNGEGLPPGKTIESILAKARGEQQ